MTSLRGWVWVALFVSGVVSACGSAESPHEGANAGSSSGGASAAAAGGSSAGASSAGQASASAGAGAISSAPIAVADLCPVFTHDLCVYLTQCLGAQFRDLDQCEAEVDCYGLPELQASAAKGNVLYDPAQVGACHARFASDPCNFATFLFTPDIFEVLSYCPNTLTPKLGMGGACVSDGECTAGLFCKKTDNTCPGACAPFAASGQSCQDGTPCAPGSSCNQRGLCHGAAKPGDACQDGSDCNDNDLCLGDDCPAKLYCDVTSGTCKLGVSEGMQCGAIGGTSAPMVWCENGLFCDAVFINDVGVCRKPGGAGTACNQSGCVDGFHCVGYAPLGASPTLGVCAGTGAAGTECGKPADCSVGLACVGALCATPVALGTACDSDQECATGLVCDQTCKTAGYPGDACSSPSVSCVLSRCVDGTCMDHQKVGQTCAADDDCATQRCIGNVCVDTSVCRQ